ncbi:hypothetical protein, partial [Neorhodopirellula pilleata]|uniref:hypothetical protein n=1 Tax=Neorhodopirellula pilleata TaxID=2714738 RepID=UPI001E3E7A92
GFLNRGLELRLVALASGSDLRTSQEKDSNSNHASPRSQILIGYPSLGALLEIAALCRLNI